MPEGSNQLNDNALTNSIVSQGAGYSHGLAEARRVRDSWDEDHRAGERHLEGAHWDGERTRDILTAIGKAEVAVEKTAAATELAVEKTAAADRVATQAGFNQGRTDAIDFANQARTDLFKASAATDLAIEKTGAAAALLASQNYANIILNMSQQHCDIKAAIAECCCELKEQHALTRSRIDGLETDRLRSELNEARSAVTHQSILAAIAGSCGKGGNGPGNS